MDALDGYKIAENIYLRLQKLPVPKRFLAGVIVGTDAASESFQKIKEEAAGKLGADYRIYHLDATLGNDGLRQEVGKIAAHQTCGGVIVQLPLPQSLNRHYVCNAIPANKDPDMLSARSLGDFYTGRSLVLPPAVATLSELLRTTHYPPERADSSGRAGELSTASVAVIGLGFLIGRPIVQHLMGKVKNLYLLDRGADFSVLKNCDLIISGTGQAGLIKPDMLKDDASVIDFGYGHRTRTDAELTQTNADKNYELCGDFDSSLLSPSPIRNSSLEISHSFYTPVPGGTGPILVAKLMENFYVLNHERVT